MPDRGSYLARSRDAGWEPWDGLHEQVVAYVRLAASFEHPTDWRETSPDVEWPYGKWLFNAHRAAVHHHLSEQRRVAAERR